MTCFQPGDVVQRIGHPWGQVRPGDLCTVSPIPVPDRPDMMYLDGQDDERFSMSMFVLISRKVKEKAGFAFFVQRIES